MRLFETSDRTYESDDPAIDHLSVFEHYACIRSERTLRVRNMLESMFAEIPEATQEQSLRKRELLSKMRSGDNLALLGAFFEVYLFNFFKDWGCEIDFYQSTTGGGASPDFNIVFPDGTNCIVEARAVSGLRRSIPEARKRQQVVALLSRYLKGINRFDLHIGLEFKSTSKCVPTKEDSKTGFEQFLSEFDKSGHQQGVYHAGFTIGGRDRSDVWRIDVSIQRVRGAKESRIPWVSEHETYTPDDWEGIRTALHSKRPGRYRSLQLPYMIAIMAGGLTTKPIDAVDALYGKHTEHWMYDKVQKRVVETRVTRELDGAWGGRIGSANRSIAGLLCFLGLHYEYICQGKALYLPHPNPYPEKAYKGYLEELASVRFEDGFLHARNGTQPNEFMSICKSAGSSTSRMTEEEFAEWINLK